MVEAVGDFFRGILKWVFQNPYEAGFGLTLFALGVLIPWLLGLPQKALLFFARKVLARSYSLQDALQLLGESVELIDKHKLAHPASPQRIRQFYDGGNLSWDVIAAGGDIERDKHCELLRVLRTKEQGLRLVCVVGSAGAGKSTATWRAAMELYRQDRALVVWAKRPDNAEFWFHLSEFHSVVRRDVYILVDDLFRHHEVVQALRALDPALPITILATAQTAEYHPHRLTCQPLVVPLGDPSEDEKARMLERLGRSRHELTPDQQARLNRATDFRIMMLELTTGRDHVEAITETVRRLAQTDPIGYDAYKYVCFCYQYGVSIPNSVVERLHAEGRFHRIDQRPAVQGLILPDEAHPGYLRTGHAGTAATAFGAYYQAPLVVLSELVSVVDEAQHEHRRFIAHLVSRALSTKEGAPRGNLTDIAPVLSSLARCAERIGEILLWRRCFRTIGMASEAHACEDALTEDALINVPPVNAGEWSVLVGAFREMGREEKALLPLLTFVQGNPQTNGSRLILFNLVERYGTRTQVDDTVLGSREWLADHPEDNSFVRTAFLGLVERKGTPEQIQGLIDGTRTWLADHPQDTSTRAAFLGLVERKGTPEQVQGLIDGTRTWLAEHPEDTHTRQTFLGLVERHPTSQQVQALIDDTHAWLADHPEDTSTRTTFLGLVERKGTPEQIQGLIDGTRTWLADHLEDTSTRAAFLGLVERKGTPEQVQGLIDGTRTWLAEHPEDTHTRQTFLGLVERHPTSQQVQALIDDTHAWLADHPEDTSTRAAFLGLVERKGTPEQVQGLINGTHGWLAEHPADIQTRQTFLGLVERKGTSQQVRSAIQATGAWWASNINDVEVRRHLLRLIDRSGDNEELSQAARDLAAWSEQTTYDTQSREVRLISTALSGGPRLSHVVTDRIQEAVDRLGVDRIVAEGFPNDPVQQTYFANWLRDHQYHDEAERLFLKILELPLDRTSNRSRNQVKYGYGQLLLKAERWPEAAEVFRQLPRTHTAARLGLARALVGMAQIAKDKGDISAAGQRFQEGERELDLLLKGKLRHALRPSPAHVLSRLGWLYLFWEKFEKALAAFEEAISTAGGEHFLAFWGKGKALVELARIGKASFQDAQVALTTAKQLLRDEMEGHAADEIRRLLKECDEALEAKSAQ
jgi:tetratricopeptide (TPR) repeat protein